MSKTRVVTSALSAVVFLTLASSARADVIQADKYLEKLIYAERHNLTVFDSQSAETGYLYAGHFENNNGKHLGFSVAAISKGPKLGIVRPSAPTSSVSQNPEPTAMVLLGTGLAAVAAVARRKKNRRRDL